MCLAFLLKMNEEYLKLSDTKEFSDASEESVLDDSKLSGTSYTYPVPIDEFSDGHFELHSGISLENSLQNLNLSNSENMSYILSPRSGLFSNNSVLSFESPRLNYNIQASVETLKKVLCAVNDAHVNWVVNEFMLKCCLHSMQKLPKEIASKMKEVIVNSRVEQLPRLSTTSGETFSILGLSEDNLENLDSNGLISHYDSIVGNSFSQLEKNTIRRAVQNIANAEIEKYSQWKSEMQGQLGPHCDRVVGQSGLLSEDRERLFKLYRAVEEKLSQAADQLITINQLMQQLACPDRSSQDLLEKTFAFVRDKAECLHSLTSYLKFKMDSDLLTDWKKVEAINEEGDKFKADLAEGAKELKSLQTRLDQFKALENFSPEFREIVAEYNKTKKILQHKRQTLKMFEESNDSFY